MHIRFQGLVFSLGFLGSFWGLRLLLGLQVLNVMPGFSVLQAVQVVL